MKRIRIVPFLAALLLFCFAGCAGKPGEEPMPEQAFILPFEELPPASGVRLYSFGSVGLTNVLGCSSGRIVEVLAPGDHILRWYFDDEGRQLADSWGFPQSAGDVILRDGTVICNCCSDNGALRTYVHRRLEDGGIEYGCYDLEPIIRDEDVLYRSIAEEYDPSRQVYRVSYARLDYSACPEDPPVESCTIEVEDLSTLLYSTYAPSPEATRRQMKEAYQWFSEEPPRMAK